MQRSCHLMSALWRGLRGVSELTGHVGDGLMATLTIRAAHRELNGGDLSRTATHRSHRGCPAPETSGPGDESRETVARPSIRREQQTNRSLTLQDCCRDSWNKSLDAVTGSRPAGQGRLSLHIFRCSHRAASLMVVRVETLGWVPARGHRVSTVGRGAPSARPAEVGGVLGSNQWR